MTIFIAGIATGAVYALIATGYNITYLTSGALNFAFTNVMMLGGFIGYWGLTEHHYNRVVVFAVSAGVCAAVSAVEELIAIRPVMGTGTHAVLVTTVGAATVVTGVTILIWGSNPELVTMPGANHRITILGGSLSELELAVVLIAVLLSLVIHSWSRLSRQGLACRSQIEDREAAMVRGVNTRRLSLGGFAVSGIVAGLLGPVIAADIGASASNALSLAVKGFIVLIIGGVASQSGALLGGVLIGLIESYVAFYVGGNYGDIAVFAIFLVVMLTRPQGLFGYALGRAV